MRPSATTAPTLRLVARFPTLSATHIYGLALGPQGKWLALAQPGADVSVWDCQGRQLARLPNTKGCHLRLAPTATTLATYASEIPGMSVWMAPEGTLLTTNVVPNQGDGQGGWVTAIAWLGDERLILGLSTGTVWYWDYLEATHGGIEHFTPLLVTGAPISALAVNLQRTRLAIGRVDGTVSVLPFVPGQPHHLLHGTLPSGVGALQIAREDLVVAQAQRLPLCHLWDLATSQPWGYAWRYTTTAQDPPSPFILTPHAPWAWSATSLGCLQPWSWSPVGRLPAVIPPGIGPEEHLTSVTALGATPAGDVLAAGDQWGRVWIWEVRDHIHAA
jgi:WD40 repeat protein